MNLSDVKKVVFLRFFRVLGKYKLRGLEKFWVFWVFRKNKLRDLEIFWVFWCISSPGTYLERCAVKFWPSLAPRSLILKTKTFPLCKNNKNLEFWSQCKVLCVFVHFSLELIFSSLASSINNLLPLAQDNIFIFCLLPRTI